MSNIYGALNKVLTKCAEAIKKAIIEKGPSTTSGGTIWSNRDLRIDKGTNLEDGRMSVDLQINAQTEQPSLKKFAQKHSTHKKLCNVVVDPERLAEQGANDFKDTILDSVEENFSK
ncbi:hypothetical protein EYR40_007153 [Pleurotus pulmonarius]|nr:hypothetical protein EYR36_003564 [Pleurotus pulmonarius]KAF4600047.1 hypothetical protein EYR40_007153 [Pleurotus pulmonarius]